MSHARTLLLAAVAGALVLAACGDESSDGSSGEATTTVTADPTTEAPAATTPATTAASANTTTTTTAPAGRPADGAAAPTATHANLAYADTSAAQTLDLWLPEDSAGPVPLVIYVHGGAFKAGDKSMVGAKVQPLLDAGFAVASVNYRLSGEALFPAGPQDVKAAVRWLRANAATYGVDPDAFAAWGESAGGNLVALLGTTGDQSTVLDDPALGNPGTSSAVQAVVDWFGPTDFLQMDAQAATESCTSPQVHDPATSPESAYIGAALQSVPEEVAAANPITYITSASVLPAFSIAHGDADCNVPWHQSQILADTLEAAGESVDYTILPGAGHGDAQFDGTRLAPTITWLQSVLGA